MNPSFFISVFLVAFGTVTVLEIISIKFWEKRWVERNIVYCKKNWYHITRIIISGFFGVLFGFLYSSLLASIAFASFAWLVLMVIDTDFKSKKIPREPCWTVFVIATLAAVLSNYSLENLVYGVGSVIIFGGAFFTVALITRGGLGSGDVRLIIALSPMAWWLGFYPIFVGLMIAFIAQFLVHIILFFVKRTPGEKRHLPFGPALGIGLLLAQIWFSLYPENIIF